MVTSYVLIMWLGIATQMAKAKGLITNSQMKSLRTDGCPLLYASNSTENSTMSTAGEDSLILE